MKPLKNILYRILLVITFQEFILLAAFFLLTIISLGMTGSVHIGRAGRICHSLILIIACFLAYVGVKDTITAPREVPTSTLAWQISKRTFTIMRDWLPLFFAISMYSALYGLTESFNMVNRDAELLAADRFIFGETPAILFDNYIVWWVTEILSMAYMTMMFFPPVLLCCLYIKGDRRSFQRVTVSLMVLCFLGYSGYFLVPAIGPAKYMPKAFKNHLLGGSIANIEQTFIQQSRNPRDCFPSMHTAIPTLMNCFAATSFRPFLVVGLPLLGGIMMATLYLRYHYFVDIVAGLLLALLVYFFTTPLMSFWQGEQERISKQLSS